MRKFIGSAVIVLSSALTIVLVVEVACHFIFNPVDYLAPDRKEDPILKYKILPGSGGHDEWGFRNKSVPDKVSIVTIGDSQTYGYNATAANSYPYQLAKQLNTSVYNLSLGGYGPVQYEHLLNEYALKLHPEHVITGLYFGNDIADAFICSYSLDHWKHLRLKDDSNKSNNQIQQFNDVELLNKKEVGLSGSIRHWLAGNSILYQMLTKIVFRNLGSAKLNDNGEGVFFENEKMKLIKTLTPKSRFENLDTSDFAIKEGLRITINRLTTMAKTCREKNIKFSVLFIPTAEYVYSDHYETSVKKHHLPLLQKLIAAEMHARTIIGDSLEAANVPVIDGGKIMKEKLHLMPDMYLPGPDGHPTASGYQLLSEAVINHLNSK